MTMIVKLQEAEAHLSELIERVRQGEEIVIAKRGTPVAKLVPVGQGAPSRVPGSARGQISLSPDFDAPLSGNPGNGSH